MFWVGGGRGGTGYYLVMLVFVKVLVFVWGGGFVGGYFIVESN